MQGALDNQDGSADFTTTQWSVVLDARHNDPRRARAALEHLCSRYWYPLYAFVRRRGHSAEDAEDLTQAFFAHLLGNDGLSRADRTRGLFRTFLLSSLVNFLSDQWDRHQAAKRGGGHRIVSWDAMTADELYRHEPLDSFTPEKLFERRWAFTVIQEALSRLRQEAEAAGKTALFEVLEPCLTGEVAPGFYADTAAKLGTTEGSVRVNLHRLRRRLGDLLRKEIAQTVSAPDEVRSEIQRLFDALGS